MKWFANGNFSGVQFLGKFVVATNSYAKIQIFDAATGKAIRTIETTFNGAPQLGIAKDGKLLVASGPMNNAGDKYAVQTFLLGK